MTMVMSLDEKQSERTGVHERKVVYLTCMFSTTFGQMFCFTLMVVCDFCFWMCGKRLCSVLLCTRLFLWLWCVLASYCFILKLCEYVERTQSSIKFVRIQREEQRMWIFCECLACLILWQPSKKYTLWRRLTVA